MIDNGIYSIGEEEEALLEARAEGREKPADRFRVDKLLESPVYREYLDFLMALGRAAADAKEEQPPADLIERTLQRLFKIRRYPRFRFASAMGLAAAGILVGIAATLWWTGRTSNGFVTVKFTLNAPRAERVAIVGDFTDWRPVGLERSGDTWEVSLQVPRPGRYQYSFVLNGRMLVIDPKRDEVEQDRRGTCFSVLDTSVI